MKYLGLPNYDDVDIVRRLAQKDNLASYPLLGQNLQIIELEYMHYGAVGGDANRLHRPLALDAALKQGLQDDYGKKLKDLAYITEIRKNLSKDVCPMCGSFSTGQVDHFIPKSEYPEFSLFSRNLVPVCACNQKKSKTYGDGVGGRMLHPYYDPELNERVAYIEFSGDVAAPDVEVEIVLRFKTNQYIKYHIDSVLRKTEILNWAGGEWSKIQKQARSIFYAPEGKLKKSDVKLLLEQVFLKSDRYYGTPNNWKSMFYYGLTLKEDYFEYIRDCINADVA